MKKVIASVLVVSIVVTQLGGCASTGATQTQQGAAIGAVGGAALGAAVSKNRGKGALIGAVIGLLIGAAIGNYRDQQDATRAEAASSTALPESFSSARPSLSETSATAPLGTRSARVTSGAAAVPASARLAWACPESAGKVRPSSLATAGPAVPRSEAS